MSHTDGLYRYFVDFFHQRKSDDAALQPSTSTVVKKIKSSVDDDNQLATEGSSCIVTACDDVKMASHYVVNLQSQAFKKCQNRIK